MSDDRPTRDRGWVVAGVAIAVVLVTAGATVAVADGAPAVPADRTAPDLPGTGPAADRTAPTVPEASDLTDRTASAGTGPIADRTASAGTGPLADRTASAGEDPSGPTTTVDVRTLGPDHAGPGGPTTPASVDRTYSTVITGQVRYQNQDGSMSPARQVKVHVRKDNTVWFNSGPFAKDTTNSTGHYQIRVDTDKRETAFSPKGATLNLKVQVLAKNPAARVIAFKKNLQGGSGRTYHLSQDLQIQVGQSHATVDFDITGQENRRVFQIAEWALRAREFTGRVANYKRNRLKVHFPGTTDRYFSTVDKIKIDDANWGSGQPRTTVFHEYGHAVNGGLSGYVIFPIPKVKNWKLDCHDTYAETDKKYAWFEGFAEYFAAIANDHPDTRGYGLERTAWYNQSVTNTDCPNGDSGQDFDGEIVEGAVANVLWDVTDGPGTTGSASEAFDDLNASIREVFATVSKNQLKSSIGKRNTKKVWNIHDFWDQFVTPENHAELGRIYFEYGVQKPDEFEDNDAANKAASVATNTTHGGQLNYGDSADHFEFSAQKNQRVTVDVDGIQGDANVTLRVYGPGGSEVARNLSSGGDQSVQFQAPASGTYRFRLKDLGNGRTAGTYQFNVTVEPDSVYDDGHEQNDALSSATNVSKGKTKNLLFPVFDTLDYYALNGTKGKTLEVTAKFDHSKVDVDLFAYSPTASNNRQVAQSASHTDDEHLSIRAYRDDTYYVLVSGSDLKGKTRSYDLEVSEHGQVSRLYEDNDHDYTAEKLDPILNKTGRPGNRSGYVDAGHRKGDDDYYSVYLNGAQNLHVKLNNGSGIKVRVIGPSGSVRGTVYSQGNDVTTDPGSSGTYYIRVWGYDHTNYNVSVTYGRGAGSDHLEPNGNYKYATPATPTIPIVNTTANRTFNNLQANGARNDKDYFAVKLGKGEQLTATATHDEYNGELKMEIIGTTGQTQTFSQTGSSRPFKVTGSVTASSSGTFYVLVTEKSSSWATDYDLEIRKTESVAGSYGIEVGTGDIDLGELNQGINHQVGIGGGGDWPSLANVSLGQNVGPGSGKCELVDAFSRSRTVSSSGGQSARIGKSYTFPADYPGICKVEATIVGPKRAQVDVYVTIDGSMPTSNNYQIAADAPGSNETLTITRADGLGAAPKIRVLAQAYPIAGKYEVIVKVYARSGS